MIVDFGIGANLTGAVAAPFNTPQKQPVGEQNPDALDSSLPPVEQVAEDAATKRVTRDGSKDVQQEAERGQEKSDARIDQLQQSKIEDQVRVLARRDREVKSHEATHKALAGRYAGAPSYEFKKGPDGVLYAFAGSVSIDTSPIPGDSAATLRKAQVIKRAAMGPSDPSAADRAIASAASNMAANASAELAREMQRQREQDDSQEGVEADEPINASVTTTQSAERSDRSSKEEEEKEVEDIEPAEIELPTQIIDAALNKKLVELGVFRKTEVTGMTLDLTA